MKAFTFAVLTYNQERCVLYHLESIRYQVERWGDGIEIYFLLADDHSTDGTMELAQAWLRKYKTLFTGVQIFQNEQNQGIVQNYLHALHGIQTEFFKILAGDDLYYKNNVFAAAEKGSFVLSPVLYFCGDTVLRGQYLLRLWVFQEFLRYEDTDLKRRILLRQQYTNCIYTPGVFYQKSLADDRVDQLLRRYRWMEDYPLWNHLLAREDVQPRLARRPVVLYRASAGISTGPAHEKRSLYKEEYLSFLRETGSPFAKYPLWVNPYRYLYYLRYFLKGAVYSTFIRYLDARIGAFLREMALEEKQANEYLKDIRQKVERWQCS